MRHATPSPVKPSIQMVEPLVIPKGALGDSEGIKFSVSRFSRFTIPISQCNPSANILSKFIKLHFMMVLDLSFQNLCDSVVQFGK